MQRTLFAIAAAFVCIAAPAAAQDQYGVRIGYADLNLSTQAGADAMLSRIQSAAHEACERARISSLDSRERVRACVGDFTQRALAALNNDSVSERSVARRRPAEIAVAVR
jgi:UrcA family protein